MKAFLLPIFAFLLNSDQRPKIQVVQNGWLIYRYGDSLAFLPIKNQSIVPTYKNFFTEEKGDGQRMNNNYSAPPKLMLAKIIPIKMYDFDLKKVKKVKFYIQPVKYIYEADDMISDTADYQHGVMGWSFQMNGKRVDLNVFQFWNRSGDVYYLNTQDSVFALRGGRRHNIVIYPPH
jgi:hypothetical protein